MRKATLLVAVAVAFAMLVLAVAPTAVRSLLPRMPSESTTFDDVRRAPVDAGPRYVDVERVVDGDTLELGDVYETGVRVLGIDTPERGKCGYDEATASLARTVMERGAKVRLVRVEGTSKDGYGRVLRFVEVTRRDGTKVDAGLRQIQQGHAIARYDSRDGYRKHPREARYHRVSAQTSTQCEAFDVDGPE